MQMYAVNKAYSFIKKLNKTKTKLIFLNNHS